MACLLLVLRAVPPHVLHDTVLPQAAVHEPRGGLPAGRVPRHGALAKTKREERRKKKEEGRRRHITYISMPLKAVVPEIDLNEVQCELRCQVSVLSVKLFMSQCNVFRATH